MLFRSDKSVIVPLHDRLDGRSTQKDIFHAETNELIIAGGELITEALADEIVNAGITAVEIRSVLGCNAKGGVCRKCYGRNLATKPRSVPQSSSEIITS